MCSKIFNILVVTFCVACCEKPLEVGRRGQDIRPLVHRLEQSSESWFDVVELQSSVTIQTCRLSSLAELDDAVWKTEQSGRLVKSKDFLRLELTKNVNEASTIAFQKVDLLAGKDASILFVPQYLGSNGVAVAPRLSIFPHSHFESRHVYRSLNPLIVAGGRLGGVVNGGHLLSPKTYAAIEGKLESTGLSVKRRAETSPELISLVFELSPLAEGVPMSYELAFTKYGKYFLLSKYLYREDPGVLIEGELSRVTFLNGIPVPTVVCETRTSVNDKGVAKPPYCLTRTLLEDLKPYNCQVKDSVMVLKPCKCSEVVEAYIQGRESLTLSEVSSSRSSFQKKENSHKKEMISVNLDEGELATRPSGWSQFFLEYRLVFYIAMCIAAVAILSNKIRVLPKAASEPGE